MSHYKKLTDLILELKTRDVEAASIISSIVGSSLALDFLNREAIKGTSNASALAEISLFHLLGTTANNALVDELRSALKVSNPTLHDVISAELQAICQQLGVAV